MSDPLEQLLLVQEHDSRLDQLRHRRAALPERAEADTLRAELGEAQLAAAEGTVAADEVGREQKRLEDEVALVAEKAAAVDTKMYSGTVTNPKELQDLQKDLDQLRRHQSALEDELLVIMEAAEERQGAADAGAVAVRAVEARLAEVEQRLIATEAEIDVEIDGVARERAELVAAVPDALLARYEALRPKVHGPAVARLEGTHCSGCHLTLPATEIDRLKHLPADTIATCDQCGCLLVRPAAP